MKKNNVPEGLHKCAVCGEYKGQVIEDGEEGNITVSCICSGILCHKCKVNMMRRPISNSYDEESNTIGHCPYFMGWFGCWECRNEKFNEATRLFTRNKN